MSYIDDPYEEGTETVLLPLLHLLQVLVVTSTIPMKRELPRGSDQIKLLNLDRIC